MYVCVWDERATNPGCDSRLISSVQRIGKVRDPAQDKAVIKATRMDCSLGRTYEKVSVLTFSNLFGD